MCAAFVCSLTAMLISGMGFGVSLLASLALVNGLLAVCPGDES